jgi:hypothetical protein
MKTKYKYIEMIEVTDVPPDELPYWSVINSKHKAELGRISWYWMWRQKVFFPNRDSILVFFSSDCLRDIADFIEQLKRKEDK